MKQMQDYVLLFACYLERIYALLTWAHPAKTLFFAFGAARRDPRAA